MSKQKQNNPEIDFGFYAAVPRLLRTGYRQLTPAQKWLYTCLKDLCGDKGTCYRTLRVLATETGLSYGLLSESIPLLHSVGLIHAEKKKRSTGGKEVWHITIVDIWQENGKAHPTKRSQNEQNQQVSSNANVQNMNETPPECSQNERECSQNGDRRKNSLSKNITEERRENSKPESPQESPSQKEQKENPSSPSSSENKNKMKSTLSAEAMRIIALWEEIEGEPVLLTKKITDAALLLEKVKPTKEQLLACKTFCLKDNPEWYKTHGLDLASIANNWAKWRSVSKKQATPNPTSKSGLIAATPGSQYIVEELQSRYDDNFQAWLKTPEGIAAMAEYDAEQERQSEQAEEDKPYWMRTTVAGLSVPGHGQPGVYDPVW